MEAIKVRNLFETSNWEDAIGYHDGTLRTVLRDDANGKTILLKLPPGFYMAPHSHLTTEEHFILDGSYEINGETFGKGSYQIFEPHSEHGPFYSKDGALVLVMWDALN